MWNEFSLLVGVKSVFFFSCCEISWNSFICWVQKKIVSVELSYIHFSRSMKVHIAWKCIESEEFWIEFVLHSIELIFCEHWSWIAYRYGRCMWRIHLWGSDSSDVKLSACRSTVCCLGVCHSKFQRLSLMIIGTEQYLVPTPQTLAVNLCVHGHKTCMSVRNRSTHVLVSPKKWKLGPYWD